eukprot:407672-Pyramimonas_sp.AAC.1
MTWWAPSHTNGADHISRGFPIGFDRVFDVTSRKNGARPKSRGVILDVSRGLARCDLEWSRPQTQLIPIAFG